MGVQGTYLFAWKISFQKASRTEEYSFGVKKYEKTKKKKKEDWIGVLLLEKKRILIMLQYAFG